MDFLPRLRALPPYARPAPRSTASSAAADRRCCCCKAGRRRISNGDTSRRCSRSASPSSRRICAATATAASRPSGENHAGYSKRAMAQDQVEVMRQLGFERFAVVGHDRGGRVACRMALDHPQRSRALALLDIVPTRTVYTHGQQGVSRPSYFHWFFLIQPAPLPETLLARPGRAVPAQLSHFAEPDPGRDRRSGVRRVPALLRGSATLHAMCEDYRAGASIDLQHDEADLGTQLRLPDAGPVGRARRDASPVRRRWKRGGRARPTRKARRCRRVIGCRKSVRRRCPRRCVDFLVLSECVASAFVTA